MNDIKEKYQFVTMEDSTWQAIGISGDSKFNGVVYKYGKVTIAEEENEKGDLPFRFEYDILDPNGINREEFNEEFFTLIGDILVDILDEQLKEDNLEYADAND